MTKLNGSEKQVAWATSIRDKQIELVKYKINQLKKYNNEMCNNLISLYKEIIEKINKIENAVLFIDNRFKIAFEWIPEEEFIQNNLFWIPKNMAKK